MVRVAVTALVLGTLLAGAYLALRPGATPTAAGPTAPDLVGMPQSLARCLTAGHLTVVDERQAEPIAARFCNGISGIQPDPPVVSQRPAPGAALPADAVVTLRTACFRRRCM